MTQPLILPFGGVSPRIHESAFVAPGAVVIGDVEIGPDSSIWYNCVLRGDMNSIRIGARTNVQDGSVIHVDSQRNGKPGFPTIIGDDVLIGHMALVHGCTVGDRSMVGMGSMIMDGCVIEPEAMLAAGAMLTPGKRITTRELWAGRPARFMRALDDTDVAVTLDGVNFYAANGVAHRAALTAFDDQS